jgi:hypothetical protein
MARRKFKRGKREEEDPMAGTTNLVDAMLVISVGLLIFLVMSWNMQSVVFNDDMSQEQKKSTMEAMQQVSQINQGEKLNDTPDTSNSSGQGYVEMGKVYKDPKTGKLIMVE